MFCSITLILSTLQQDETLMWTQLNTNDIIGEKLFLENGKSCFSQLYPQLKAWCTLNLTKSVIPDTG